VGSVDLNCIVEMMSKFIRKLYKQRIVCVTFKK